VDLDGVGGPHAPFLKRKAHTRPCLALRGRKSGFAPVGMTRRGWRFSGDWLRGMTAGSIAFGFLDRREAAHFAVFQGEVLASPGYCVSGEAPDPDAQGYYVTGR
jgi:hypothetical protein